MKGESVGMYVHTHWSYNHPYAARTWTIGDWRGYLSGLKDLGYSFVQVWPMFDTMPIPLTGSDRLHLERLSKVIDVAHDEFGMKVIMGCCPNIIGNEKASGYAFEQRPYFVTERLVNPGDPDEVEMLFAHRREVLAPLSKIDGFWVIDSDPGGYEGSPSEEFVMLLGRYRELLDELRPGIQLIYWLWQGWPLQKDEAASWRAALSGLKRISPEPWAIYVCRPEQAPIVEELGLTHRAYSFRYAAIEGEPSLPWTGCDPRRLYELVTPIDGPKGRIGNAQTHPVQLPHIYCFSHFAQGGAPDTIDLEGFAERLLPGLGAVVASGWWAMNEDSTAEEIESALSALSNARPGEPGELSGLLFGNGERFLEDLRAQLTVRRHERRIQSARSPQEFREGLRGLRGPLAAWCRRHGFSDFGWLPLLTRIKESARQIGAHEIVKEFDVSQQLDHRHGFMERLFSLLKEV
ncbi:MAG: hypothetical protein J7M08_07395 [Planctomycetes bacterium]|nr:hypothetical protein [Planctomycetota bacterium]